MSLPPFDNNSKNAETVVTTPIVNLWHRQWDLQLRDFIRRGIVAKTAIEEARKPFGFVFIFYTPMSVMSVLLDINIHYISNIFCPQL